MTLTYSTKHILFCSSAQAMHTILVVVTPQFRSLQASQVELIHSTPARTTILSLCKTNGLVMHGWVDAQAKSGTVVRLKGMSDVR